MASTKRQDAKAATRAKLIKVAKAAFHHGGYDSVTMREVAKAAGVSTGAIFANFADKADLFQQAMGEKAPDVEAFLKLVAKAPDDGMTSPELYHYCEDLAANAERLRRHLRGNHA